MTTRFMLDTNIISDMVRNPRGASAKRGKAEGQVALCTSAITACELRFGARKRGSPALSERIGSFLSRIPVMPLEPPVDETYGRVRLGLEKAGTPIGPYDMLIAAHALSLGLVLVTDNVREFSRVEGLRMENWIERGSGA